MTVSQHKDEIMIHITFACSYSSNRILWILVCLMKAFGKLYWVLSLSSCASIVLRSHLNFSHTNFHWTKLQRRSACNTPIHRIKVFVWIPFNGTKLWYDFPVVTWSIDCKPPRFTIYAWSHSGEWAVSLKRSIFWFTVTFLSVIPITRILSEKRMQCRCNYCYWQKDCHMDTFTITEH